VYALEKEIKKSVFWLKKAAALGDSDAEYQLGWISEQELGNASAVAQAIQYYRQAASKGHAKAMLGLARVSQEGMGVNQNVTQSKMDYPLLVQQDNPDADYQLGLFCVYGFLSDGGLQQGKIRFQDKGHFDAGWMLRLNSAQSQETNFFEPIFRCSS
jgi:TPR repeat protein